VWLLDFTAYACYLKGFMLVLWVVQNRLKEPLKKSFHGLFQSAVFANKFSNTFQINELRVIAYWQLPAIPGRDLRKL